MGRKPTISFQTLGCKLNQAETEALARKFSGKEYSVTDGDQADVFILNTCTVTHIADRKSRHLIRMLRKNNPGALIVVTGCYAERASTGLLDCGADLVIGNHQKMSLPGILNGKLKHIGSCVTSLDAKKQLERVRSFIKIQDGCQNFCSYCIVPFVRREIYSVDTDDVVREVKARAIEGYKEVVLTGTEIGSYKYDGTGLKQLIERLLLETQIKRLHLSSLQPREITEDLLDLWSSPRLCRHFHIALQSGSDSVLRRMRRRYSLRDYRKAVAAIREKIPDVAITTDVMVGFPGESEEEFEESYSFCKEMTFAALHVFAYSPRPNTLAAKMPEKVNEKVKKQRSLRILELAAESADKFSQRFVGQTKEVLWENEVKAGSGIYSGLTDNYIRVYARSERELTNTIAKTRLIKPADSMEKPLLRASTRGNHGELRGEVI